ncbi:hypothetical protein FGB62_92g114 [Gracilaria domingensis]|nr:hypothetical protein FGB62_92g114 [Gracilaria domingensis]
MPCKKAKTAYERQEERRVHYKMPRIEGSSPVMREPARISFGALRLEKWNADHPDNKFPLFSDGYDVERRNEMHKRQIGEVLATKLEGVYRRKTFSQARIQGYQKLGDAMQQVYRIPDLAYYAAHSHNNWMVKWLTEQHMEAVSRANLRSKSRAKGRNSHDMHQGTFIQSLSGGNLRHSRGEEGGSDMNVQSRNETQEGHSSFVKNCAEGQRASSEHVVDTNAMGVTTPRSSARKKDFLPFRTSEPVGDIAVSQKLPSHMKTGDANQNDVKGPEGEQEVIGDNGKGLSVLGESNNIPTSMLRYNEYPVRDTSKLSIVRNYQGKKRKYMEDNDADEDHSRSQLQWRNKNGEAIELPEKSNSSDCSNDYQGT